MAAVTQTIDNYVNGVSREPDKEKAPGFVRDARNVYPDVTFGLTKRPGSQFTVDLGADTFLNDAYWFLYRFNDKEEMYIGWIQGDNNNNHTINLINIETGVRATVTGAQSDYLDGDTLGNDAFRYVQKHNDFYLVNKTVTTAMTADVAPGTLAGTVNTIAELPEAASLSDGDIYAVVGIAGTQDDYYLVWDGTNEIWNETVGPGALTTFDGDTMPHVLTRTATDTFTFGPATWETRPVGSTGNPSFIGEPIFNLFFHKNRFGFVSTDNVILSQPVEYLNFWRNSALTTSDADPVDLTCTSMQDVTLFAVQPMTQGLVLFSTREQFIMTSGSDGVLSPATAAIRSVSKYEMYTHFDPILVDDEILFTSDANNYTRVLSMATRGENNSPVFNDVGKPVTTWVPSGINRGFGSSQNSFIALYNNEASNLYFYRFYKVDAQNQIRSWFRWDFPGNILGHFIEQDQIFLAISANGRVHMLSMYINPNNQVPIVQTPQGAIYDNPALDYLHVPASVTYDNTTRLSTITTNSTHPDNAEWRPIAIQPYTVGDANGSFWELTRVNDTTFTAAVDLTSVTGLLFGYAFPMDIELPKTYYRQGDKVDFTASLTIARMKFAMGKTGAVGFEVRPRGSATFSGVGEVGISNWYLLDSAPIDDERVFNLPLHQRNDNFDIRISSDSPYPTSLLSMSWEGQYSPRYYRRS